MATQDPPLSAASAQLLRDLRDSEAMRRRIDEPFEREPPPTQDQLNLQKAYDQSIWDHGDPPPPPIHEVLLDERSPASELVRAHLESMSDVELADSWYKLELQSQQLHEDPGSSDWVKAGWDVEHASTMIGCSVRATDREMARREALKKSRP